MEYGGDDVPMVDVGFGEGDEPLTLLGRDPQSSPILSSLNVNSIGGSPLPFPRMMASGPNVGVGSGVSMRTMAQSGSEPPMATGDYYNYRCACPVSRLLASPSPVDHVQFMTVLVCRDSSASFSSDHGLQDAQAWESENEESIRVRELVHFAW